VVASPDWAARHGPLASPAALAEHACLRLALRTFRTRWLFRRSGQDQPLSVPIDGRFLFSTPLAIREAAVAGMGPALLVDWQVEADLAAGRLVDLLPQWAATATTFETGAWAVYPSRAFLPAKVRVMIDFLRTHLAGGD
jgi:DNA-binding transcriptional LysR family regulator